MAQRICISFHYESQRSINNEHFEHFGVAIAFQNSWRERMIFFLLYICKRLLSQLVTLNLYINSE